MPYPVYRATVSSLLSKIHGTLNTLGIKEVGLSMPGYYKAKQAQDSQLGDCFHLICENEALLTDVVNAIDLEDMLMIGMIKLSVVQPVPENLPRAIFKRRRVEDRYYARKDAGWKSPNLDRTYPFFNYLRPGKKKGFQITVEKQEGDSREGQFNTYGLSSTRSVPIISSH